jgi:hypothetical protein
MKFAASPRFSCCFTDAAQSISPVLWLPTWIAATLYLRDPCQDTRDGDATMEVAQGEPITMLIS